MRIRSLQFIPAMMAARLAAASLSNSQTEFATRTRDSSGASRASQSLDATPASSAVISHIAITFDHPTGNVSDGPGGSPMYLFAYDTLKDNYIGWTTTSSNIDVTITAVGLWQVWNDSAANLTWWTQHPQPKLDTHDSQDWLVFGGMSRACIL